MWMLIVQPETADVDAAIVVYDEAGQMRGLSNSIDVLLPWLISQGQTEVVIQDAAGVYILDMELGIPGLLVLPTWANQNDPPGQTVNGDPSTDLGFELRPPRRFCGDRPLPFVREPL